MSRFWVDRVRALHPYVPGEQPVSRDLLKLNTNEHALPPSDLVMAAIRGVAPEALRRYPEPTSLKLRQAIAEREGLNPDQVFVGNGSDEVLAHLWQAFLSGRSVTTLDITYGFYPVWAELYQSDLHLCPLLGDFSVDVTALEQVGTAVVLPNPNAPTGRALTVREVEQIVSADDQRLVIVDEAYFGFGAPTAAPLIARYDNLIVTRSLSKSHALAGLRVGFALASADLIEGLNRVKDSFNSYPLDAVAQAAATAAILDDAWLEAASQSVKQSRSLLESGLVAMGFEVLPSEANFIFTRHPQFNGERLFESLREADIIVRRWSGERIQDWLRISIGTLTQSEQLLATLRNIVASKAG